MSHQIILETIKPLSKEDAKTMNEIREACGISRPTALDRVNRCERRGLVFTIKSGREKLVYLTDKGKKLRNKIINMESTLYGVEI